MDAVKFFECTNIQTLEKEVNNFIAEHWEAYSVHYAIHPDGRYTCMVYYKKED